MSYIIGFFNKHRIQVSDETGEKIKKLMNSDAKAFEITGDMYTFSSIESIVNKHTAYDLYPKDWELLQSMEDAEVQLPSNPMLENKGMEKL